ncbi:MAG: ABC transporter ATP-binding protein [Planctomycetales bacterium]|nr:ABC transporter ATP-binding protein [Planctomycetales bacterium]
MASKQCGKPLGPRRDMPSATAGCQLSFMYFAAVSGDPALIPKSLSALISLAGRQQLTLACLLGSVIALFVPLLSFILGSIVECLIRGEGHAGEQQSVSWILPNLHEYLPNKLSILGQVSVLLGAELLLLFTVAVLLYFFYRSIQQAAILFEVELIKTLRRQAKVLATARTLAAQETALTDCLEYHLPRVRLCASRWWKTYPRHLVQIIACVLLGVLIQPMLGLLTMLAAAFVAMVYRFLDRMRRTSLPVVRERAAQQRTELTALCLEGPLLESVHDESAVDHRFNEELAHYQRDATKSLTSSAWKSPCLIVIASGLAVLFLFVASVQILGEESQFSVAGALTFSLCFLGAAASAYRLQASFRELQTIGTASGELERFLALQAPIVTGQNLKAMQRVSTSAQLDHVTLQDSHGRKLLENVSATFKPGMLIGVVASQRIQARALVELLMGFGRPVSGRLLFDGELVTDITPESIAHCAHWVAADGSIVTATVQDNLLSANGAQQGDLHEAIAKANLTETLQKLPDGLSTLITPGDDRLRADAAFRIGLARAAMTSASIIVIDEPAKHFELETEKRTLDAIRGLVHHSKITVVLPQRLSTLRNCEVVVMLHDHKVADCGTHADLLQRNELYRHVNYLRFNPFRSLPD